MATSRSRKLTRKRPAKERQIARAIFARAKPGSKGLALAKTLQRSATRKLGRRKRR